MLRPPVGSRLTRALKLALNMLTGSLDSRITFARADATSCATYFGSDGLLKTAAANVARFDYDPATLLPRGLLIEESRTNLLLQSRDMTQAAWSKADVTPTRNQIGLDRAANSACLMTHGATTSGIASQGGASVSAGSTITASGVFTRGNTDWILLIAAGSGTATNGANGWFNLNTGAVGATSARGAGTAITSSITSLGGGWYRCALTCVPNGSYTTPFMFILPANGNSSLSTVANATYILDYAQLEVGSTASSPIATTTAAVTRAADVASMTGTNFSSWYNQTQGTFVVQFDRVQGTIVNVPLIASASAAYGLLYTNGSQIKSYDGTNSATTVGLVNHTSSSALAKAAVAYTIGTNFTTVGDGQSPATSAGSVNSSEWYDGTLKINSIGAITHIRSISYYNTALPSATLQALTT